ncbi:hypothetical protein [Globicatella sp. PHS-GS-PNBC-21-1553]|uniref:hypothetical protein n=1 Tax=Globicatella sp. PHS-GS-PNBC-21-1553 TaxID=2885764 RepID=UPI00298EEC84|nr:hypothetical protein [Globicatella sp. PHS-GS-PNBC-21-1553]WPC08621.1 hypothetical protein LB888_11630 [Globicatella sp. PHS-GS-PNBC-21-1553]
MNYLDFLGLVASEEFKAEKYEHVYHQAMEQLYDYGNIISLFDDLMKEFGRVPSKTEYVEVGVERAKEFFTSQPTQWLYKEKIHYTFEWNEHLKDAVKARLGRTYSSYLIEEQVKVYLKSHFNCKIASNQYIDMNFGVDVVVKHEGKLYYIHIAKNSQASKRMLKEKKNRKSYIPKDGKKCYWTRDWGSAHHLLLFNDVDSDRMKEINGNLLFDERYLEKYFEELFANADYDLADETSEIWKFKEFLRKNKIK